MTKSLWSSLLAGLVVGVFVVLGLYAHKSLEVHFTVWTDADLGDRFELFYERGGAGFHPLRSEGWPAPEGEWTTREFAHTDFRRLTRLRFDPMMAPGEVRLGEVRLQGRGGSLALSGTALRDAIIELHALDSMDVVDDFVYARSTGIDPQWVIEVPRSLYAPSLNVVIAAFFSGGLFGAGLWWVFTNPAVRGYLTIHRRMVTSLLGLVLCSMLTLHAAGQIDANHIYGDGSQNLRIAYNLYKYGEYSLDPVPPFRPVSAREPVFPWTTSLVMGFLDPARQIVFEDYLRGEYLTSIKRINIFWIFSGLVSIWMLGLALIGNRIFAALAVVLSYAFFLQTTPNIFYTEMHTSVLMLWAALLAVYAQKETGRWTPGLWLLLGLLLGVLALTKALFFYVALVFIPLLTLIYLVDRKGKLKPFRLRFMHSTVALVLMSVGLAAVVAPWMMRNQMVMGSYALSEGRSGWVIYKRSLINTITEEEHRLGYALFGPSFYTRLVARSSHLGIESADYLSRDGRVARLSPHYIAEYAADDLAAREAGRPENAISFYQKTAATYVRERMRAELAGAADPALEADRWLMHEGMDRILEDLAAHLRVTPLLMWRGFWSFPPEIHLPFTDDPVVTRGLREAINLILGLSLFGLFLWGFLRRDGRLIAVTALPVGMMFLYALGSQSLTRFNQPAIPFMMLSGLWFLHGFFGYLITRTSSRFAAR